MLFVQTDFLPRRRKEMYKFFNYHWKMSEYIRLSKKFNALVPRIVINFLGMDKVFDEFASVSKSLPK